MNSLWLASTPQIHDLLDANGDRHAEAGHSVEDVAADPCLGLLIGQSPGGKTPADDGLVSVHRGFTEAPPGISGAALPSKAPMLFDRSKMLIAQRRPGLARNRGRSRRNDHGRRGMALHHRIVNRLAVIGSIGGPRTTTAVDLVQQIPWDPDAAHIIRQHFSR